MNNSTGMMIVVLTLIALLANTYAFSIGTASDKNVTKREDNPGDLFPDWVPFKNKHGEELGEFVQVQKPKPKKRLAHPMSFVLKAVAEPQSDDYYDKGQGDADGEDAYEKKDWSDVNRPVEDFKNINHTEISDINGVVNIITEKPNAVVEALNKAIKYSGDNKQVGDRKQSAEDSSDEEPPKPRDAIDSKIKPNSAQEEEDEDYDENNLQKEKSEQAQKEQKESEARKAKILDSVDELKLRHAVEQKALSEKLKEEELYEEEHDRDKVESSEETEDKYAYRRGPSKVKLSPPEYEEYDGKFSSLEDKYKVLPERTKPTTTRVPKRTIKKKSKRIKSEEPGKLSVFRNPQLYMVDEDSDSEEDEKTTTKPKLRTNKLKEWDRKGNKFSAKYKSNSDESERISLIPDERDVKDGEPTLFFPKRRKNKKRKGKTQTDTPYKANVARATHKPKKPDVTKSAEVGHTTATAFDSTAADATASDSIINTDTTAGTGPSATASDAEVTNTDTVAVTDTLPASSDHKEKEKPENFHTEKGGGKEFSSSHEEEHSESGKKAYEGSHKETKSAKGHHDKENHSGEYDDHGGHDKLHEEESGHYGDHNHEEHGKKHATYEELGKHSKGHSTKGSHDIHKKEEYEKKVEFFEEEGDSAEEEKHGGHNEERGHAKGGHFKKGDFNAGKSHQNKAQSGHFAKSGQVHVSKGHKDAGGHDHHGKKGHKQFNQGGQGGGKKWVFHHGYPAMNANLVVIDRRTDQLQHGPRYYG